MFELKEMAPNHQFAGPVDIIPPSKGGQPRGAAKLIRLTNLQPIARPI
jgi:hypothetical protein